MDPITTFSAPVCRKLHEEMEAALEPIARKYGLTVRRGGGTFTDSGWTAKFDVLAASTSGAPTGKEADAFRALHSLYGFKQDDLGATVICNGQKTRIVGLMPRGRLPVLVERGGKLYRQAAEPLLRLLGRKGEE